MSWHRRFFILLLILLPTQLGYHFWPEWAMVLGRRVDYLSPTLYVTDIIIFILLVSWFFEFRPRIRMHIAIPLLLFAVLNIWIAKNQPVALFKWLKTAEFILLGWYIVRTKPSASFFVTTLSLGVFYSSILAIVQFALQRSIGGPLWWLGERTFNVDTPGIARIVLVGRELLRPYATFPHPNVLGGFIATVLPFIIIQLSNNPINKLSNKKKIYYLVTFILGTIALLLTFSRSAWVGGVVGIGISIWYLVYRKKKRSFFSSILYTIPFILIVVTVVSTVSPQEESVVVRRQLNAAALSMWQHSPAFGVGLGNFLVELPKNLVSRQIYFLQPVHNIYLLALSEIGVMGFLLFVWFLQKIFRHPFGTWHLAFGILLMLGLVDHYPLTLQQGQLLLTVLAGMSIASVH